MIKFWISHFKSISLVIKSQLLNKISLKFKHNQVVSSLTYFFSSFSASAALFNRAPKWRLFALWRRSVAYALNDFISSVIFTNSIAGFTLKIGNTGPRNWVAVASSSGVESPQARSTKKFNSVLYKRVHCYIPIIGASFFVIPAAYFYKNNELHSKRKMYNSRPYKVI